MDVKGRARSTTVQISEDEMDLRRGPWTVDEDFTLINYIANHGEGRWNSLARCAGTYTKYFPFTFFYIIFPHIPKIRYKLQHFFFFYQLAFPMFLASRFGLCL